MAPGFYITDPNDTTVLYITDPNDTIVPYN